MRTMCQVSVNRKHSHVDFVSSAASTFSGKIADGSNADESAKSYLHYGVSCLFFVKISSTAINIRHYMTSTYQEYLCSLDSLAIHSVYEASPYCLTI